MARTIVDQILKEMSELYPDPFVLMLLPRAKFRVISTQLDKELTIKSRLTDRAIMLETAEGKRIIHFEFLLRYRRTNAERVFVYSGALTAKYEMPVSSFLLLVKPSRLAGSVGVYRSDLFNKTTNEFTFPVIHLGDLRESILSGEKKYRVLAPLLLELDPKPKITQLRKVRDLVNLETNAQRRNELISFFVPIARRHFGLRAIQNVLKETAMNTNVEWERLPYYGEVLKAKKREAHQEAGVMALQGILVDLLNDQFGHVPERTVRAVQAIQKSSQLKAIVRKSRKAESLAEVRRLLLAYRAKTNGRNGHR